jgi:4-hydroxybenzoate polyprenyltransferase
MISRLKILLRTLRIVQWSKNLLVFLLPISDGQFILNDQNITLIKISIEIFFALSLISSINYIINDLIDFDYDKLHPIKKFRPIPSEIVSSKQALIIILGLSILLLINLISLSNINVIGILFVFFALQLLYSIFLKRIIGLDVVVLATLFLIRAFIPYLYWDINFSPWFFITLFSTSLYFVFIKRYSELSNLNNKQNSTRGVLSLYSSETFYLWQNVTLAMLVISYLNWSIENFSNNGILINTSSLISLLLVVVYLIRFSDNVFKYKIEDSLKLFVVDKVNLVLILLIFLSYSFGKGFF